MMTTPSTNTNSDTISEYLVSLETTEPTDNHDDLEPFRDHFASAQVIALGEATHGTREFFQLKHRLLRYLISEIGFRIVGLEANFPETLAIDDYVVHGRGDPRSALDGIYFWTWNVESVLELIEWLRAFNSDRPLEDRVRFYGIDAQFTHGAVRLLREYLETVDPAFLERVADAMDTVDDEARSNSQDDRLADRIEAAERLVPVLRHRLTERREAYTDATSPTAWRIARHHFRIIDQAAGGMEADLLRKMDETDDDAATERCLRRRDRAMANNVHWLLEHEDTDRIALWAHDTHINRVGQQSRKWDATAPSLGTHLAGQYGKQYYAMGFAFARGSFQAIARKEEGDSRTLREVRIEGPRNGTLEATIAETAQPLAVLDLRTAGRDERLSEWLSEARPHFSVGAVYDPESPDEYLTGYRFAESFDGVCYVEETTRARPVDE